MVIDFHTHAFPDFLAPKAIDSLCKSSPLTPFRDGTVSSLISLMDVYGIDKSAVLSIAAKPKQEESVNSFAISLSENPRIIPFGSVFPGSETWEEQLERISSAGIKGIKLHPEYQNFFLDSADALKIYKKCGKLGLAVSFHSGEDESYKPPFHTSPEMINKICRLAPDTKFIAAHFGGYNTWTETAEKLEPSENLWLDTSMSRTKNKISAETALRIIEKIGVPHILLGSDSPWEKQCDSIDGIKRLGLSDSETNMILGENASKLLNM